MSAQLEDGYTRIANELLDKLIKIHLNGNEWKIVHCVMRQTWGWRKKIDRISLTQFTKHTNLNRSSVNKIIKSLVAKQILVAIQQPSGNEYQIQKDSSLWTSCYIDTSCRFATTPVAILQPVPTSREVVAILQPTKEIKENIQKKGDILASNEAVVFSYFGELQETNEKIISVALEFDIRPKDVVFVVRKMLAIESQKDREIKNVRLKLLTYINNGLRWHELKTNVDKVDEKNKSKPKTSSEYEFIKKMYKEGRIK